MLSINETTTVSLPQETWLDISANMTILNENGNHIFVFAMNKKNADIFIDHLFCLWQTKHLNVSLSGQIQQTTN